MSLPMALPLKAVYLGKRNQITLPREFIPSHTTFFECQKKPSGEIVLLPQVAIPASQAYFWTPRWQKGEREASKQIQAGRLIKTRSVKNLIALMDRKRKKTGSS